MSSFSTAQETFLITPAAAQFSSTSACVCVCAQGVFLTFASWSVLTEELICVCVRVNEPYPSGRSGGVCS